MGMAHPLYFGLKVELSLSAVKLFRCVPELVRVFWYADLLYTIQAQCTVLSYYSCCCTAVLVW